MTLAEEDFTIVYYDTSQGNVLRPVVQMVGPRYRPPDLSASRARTPSGLERRWLRVA